MENSKNQRGRRKSYLLIVIGIFVVGLAIAIMLTVYNQKLLENRGKSTIYQPGSEEVGE